MAHFAIGILDKSCPALSFRAVGSERSMLHQEPIAAVFLSEKWAWPQFA